MLSSNNKIVLSRFFEQTNFEQLIMTHYNWQIKLRVSKESKKEVIYLRMTDFESWKGLSVCFENQRKLFKVSKKEII